MADYEPFAGMAQEETLKDLQVDIDDIILKAILRKLMMLKYDATANLQVAVASLPTLGTVTNLTTMATGNVGFGDAGKPASYQQVSAMTSDNSKRCFVWE